MKPKKRVVTEMYPRPVEFVRALKPESGIYDRVIADRVSLTDILEDTPGLSSEEYDDGMDAYERCLYVAGIRVNSDSAAGAWASTGAAFLDQENTKQLFPEFIARKIRQARFGQTRAYTSADLIPGSAERPYADNLTPRDDIQIAPAIPLSAVISETTPITGAEYRATYIENDTANQRLVRVGEGAPLPKARLKSHEDVTSMYKFGRSLEATYEQLRRMRVDRLGRHIQKITVQTEKDQVGTALDTIVNGDGNANTAAAVTAQSSLDSTATVNKLSFLAWQMFIKLFESPYVMTTALMQSDVATMLEMLNTGSANLLMVSMMQQSKSIVPITPINQTGTGLGYGWLSTAPAHKIVAWDKRFALERVIEIGSEIQEIMMWINRQVKEMTISMNEGYSVIDQSASHILDLSA